LAKKNRVCHQCHRIKGSWDQCIRGDCPHSEILAVSILDFKEYKLEQEFEIIEEKQIADPEPNAVVENLEEQYGNYFC